MGKVMLNPACILRPAPTKEEYETSMKLSTQLSPSNQKIVNAFENYMQEYGGQFLLTELSDDFTILPFVFQFLRRNEGRNALTMLIEFSLDLETESLVELQQTISQNCGVHVHDVFLHSLEYDKNKQILATVLHDFGKGFLPKFISEMGFNPKNDNLPTIESVSLRHNLQPVLKLMVTDFKDPMSDESPIINDNIIEHSAFLNAQGRYEDDDWLKPNSKWTNAMSGSRAESAFARENTADSVFQVRIFEGFETSYAELYEEDDEPFLSGQANFWNSALRSAKTWFPFGFIDRLIIANTSCDENLSAKHYEVIVILMRVDRHRACVSLPENMAVISTFCDARPYQIVLIQKRKNENTQQCSDSMSDQTQLSSALSDFYQRPKPTTQEKDKSTVLVSKSSSDIQLVARALSAAMEEMGGNFILTDDDSESDLELLPYIFTTLKPERLKYSMEFDFNYDDVVGKDEIPHDGIFARQLKEKIARASKVSTEEVVIHRVYRGSTGVGFSVPEKISTTKLQEKFPHAKISQLAADVNMVLKLSVNDFDPAGDNDNFFGGTFTRGGLPYYQPSNEWRRIGLRVKGKYDNGNDDWLMMNGNPGEWAIGFHGCRTEAGTSSIANDRYFKIDGPRQLHQSDEDVNPLGTNKGKPCGKGAYFASKMPISAVGYGLKTQIANKDAVLVFQVRLNPKTVRIPEGQPDYFIAPDVKSARPYGICIKKT